MMCIMVFSISYKYPIKHNKIKNQYIYFIPIVIGILSIYWLYNRYEQEKRMFNITKLYYYQSIDNVRESMISLAEKMDENYLTLDKTSTPANWYAGHAYYSLGNIDKAISHFKLAKEQNPYHNNVLNDLAACYSLKGEFMRSELLYKSILDVYPRFSDGLRNLAIVLYQQKEYEQAIEYLSKINSEIEIESKRFREIARSIYGYRIYSEIQVCDNQKQLKKLEYIKQNDLFVDIHKLMLSRDVSYSEALYEFLNAMKL